LATTSKEQEHGEYGVKQRKGWGGEEDVLMNSPSSRCEFQTEKDRWVFPRSKSRVNQAEYCRRKKLKKWSKLFVQVDPSGKKNMQKVKGEVLIGRISTVY